MPSLEETLEAVAMAAVEEYKAQIREQQRLSAQRWRARNPGYDQRIRTKRQVSADRLQRFRELSEQGFSQREIGELMGVSRPEVGRILRDHGIARRQAGGQPGNASGPKRLAPDLRVKELRDLGMTHREIATQLGVSSSTVGNRLKDSH